MHYINKLLIFSLILFSWIINAEQIDFYEKAQLSVVAILGDESIGSGIIISRDGYILTNWHVIADEKNFQVFTLAEGGYEENLRDAEVIKYSVSSDLALIKLTSIPKGTLRVGV